MRRDQIINVDGWDKTESNIVLCSVSSQSIQCRCPIWLLFTCSVVNGWNHNRELRMDTQWNAKSLYMYIYERYLRGGRTGFKRALAVPKIPLVIFPEGVH